MAEENKKELTAAHITESERKRIYEWFNRFMAGKERGFCPVCKTNNNWELESEWAQIPLYSRGTGVLGGMVWPCFQLICSSCGNSILINGVKTETIDPEGSSDD